MNIDEESTTFLLLCATVGGLVGLMAAAGAWLMAAVYAVLLVVWVGNTYVHARNRTVKGA